MPDKQTIGSGTQMKSIQATGTVDKIVPKFCTSINFQVTNSKLFVLTLTYGESTNDDKNPPQQTIIERVIIEHDHAKNLSKVLADLLKKVENNETNVSNPTTK